MNIGGTINFKRIDQFLMCVSRVHIVSSQNDEHGTSKEFRRKEDLILDNFLLFAKKTAELDILFSRFSENS